MKDLAWGTFPGPDGSPIGSRGGLRRASGISGVIEESSKFTNLVFSLGENRIRLTLNGAGRRAFRETTREGAAILEVTVQNWAFPHKNIRESYRFVVNRGIIKGVLFGLR